MADEKPKGAKPAEGTGLFHKDHLQDTFIFLIVLILITVVADRFAYYFQSGVLPISSLWDWLLYHFLRFWVFWKYILALPVIGVSLWWAVYSRMRFHNITKEEEKLYGKEAETAVSGIVLENKSNERWAKVITHTNSTNPSDWRLAIIEADIMLNEVLRARNYHGDTIGEMLKAVDPSDMLTLDAAWEAHKVRNRIAHSGADFELNERETKRVITLFESVFKEFQII